MKKLSINPDILKIVALIAMTIDHVYKIIFPDSAFFFIATSVIGRIAMPIFSGLLMYHLAKKQIFQKYFYRLIGFGILSLLLFLPFRYGDHSAALPCNILLTFAQAILAIWLFTHIHQDKKAPLPIRYFCDFLVVLILAPFSMFLEYDISGFGFLLSFYFYFKKTSWMRLFFLLFFAFALNNFGIAGLCSVLTTIVFLCNDFSKSYPRLIKHWYSFYLYYPLHKVLFFAIAYLMMCK